MGMLMFVVVEVMTFAGFIVRLALLRPSMMFGRPPTNQYLWK